MFCKNQQLEREATAGQNQKNIKHKNKINVQFKKKTIKSKTHIDSQQPKIRSSKTVKHTIQQTICQLHCIWKNTNSCEFMGAHARSSAHGCPWMFMVVHACVWVFMCFCLFVVLFCCHPLSFN